MSLSQPLPDFFFDSTVFSNNSVESALQYILRTVRQHLGMDIAFISEFSHGARFYRYIDASRADLPIKVGESDPLEESYCQRVADGRLPGLIPNTAKCPLAAELPGKEELPVGAFLSVPLTLSDGRVYGTFCCFSPAPDETLTERDRCLMQVFASLAAKQIELDANANEEKRKIEKRIRSVLNEDNLSIVYQPIWHLSQNRIIGFESLSRFATQPLRSPDMWFREASGVGLAVPLEMKAIRLALQGLKHLPEDVYVSINASPDAILSGAITSEIANMPLNRIVLEITEHSLIDRYDEIAAAIRPLRSRGMRIAVDDAGAGYASFRHILNLAPDIIKLDVSLTRNIDGDKSRKALAAALIRFAEETGSTIIAEGAETASELHMLQGLGIAAAQGYILNKPMHLDAASQLCEQSHSVLLRSA